MTMPRAEREGVRAQIGMLFQNGALVRQFAGFGRMSRLACWRGSKITRAEARPMPASFLAQVGSRTA